MNRRLPAKELTLNQIEIGCDLSYDVQSSAVFLFQITAAGTSHQNVISEQLTVDPQLNVESLVAVEENQIHRMVVEPCVLNVSYRATVELNPIVTSPTNVVESPASQMPPDVLTYLNPSRYCESDLLGRFAFDEFGSLAPGFQRVQAVCDWVFNQLQYTPGSTTSTTTAADVLLQRTGVCRDYAHLMIAVCRGLGVPARYVSGYAVNLQPPDFHGFVEAFLDGGWYLFDPTRLANKVGLVRIGAGRDAADTAFATITGSVFMTNKSVWANKVSGDDNQPGDDQAVSTA